MPKFVIERDIQGAGQLSADELHAISGKSNQVLAEMEGRAVWQQSYVTDDKIYCVYIADNEAAVREVEVVRLIAAGKSNRGIATELVLSEKTVARHLSNIFTKVGATSRAGVAAFAYDSGLLGRNTHG